MTRWLDDEQQRHWRELITATTLLRERLSRDLQAAHGLNLADYEILVRLSEAPDRQLRMSKLAENTLASRSRLTHQVDRLESLGWIRREPCPDDRRGQLAILTPLGFETLVVAAHTHVNGVRHHVVDPLTADQFAALGDACAAIRDTLDDPGP